jgi:serine/threonine protein phosphatase 1
MDINRHQTYAMNVKGSDYVVGDIHGQYDLLMEELSAIGFERQKDRLFCVGDIVDRGTKSFQCLKLLDEDWFYSVQGNHEEMMILCHNRPDERGMEINWRSNGGYWAVEAQEEHPEEYVRLVRKAEELPYAITVETENGRVGIVHADVPCRDWNEIERAANNSTLTLVMLWSRDRIERGEGAPIDNVDVVYLGHTPVDDVIDIENTKYIDTGACFNGNLTILKIGEE